MKEHIIKNITDKADALAVEYNKTKDPLIREEWYRIVRSLDCLSSHKQTLDTILKPPQQVVQKFHRRIK
jgi:hypothetical protein